MSKLHKQDPKIYKIIELEKKRQKENLELIPSENYASSVVLEALGSVLNNKYSEGYSHKRYYGGNQFIDMVEDLAIERAKKLFKTDYHVNVQPYSGSPANLAVYAALLKVGDKALGMALDQGGHLTHGHQVNFSGKFYHFAHYGVDKKTEKLDYDKIAKIAKKEKPKLIVCGATCYSREISFSKFRKIADGIGAILMADISHIAGLIAAGVHPTPFGYADVVTTTTHKTLRGPRGAMIFCRQQYAKDIDRAVFPGGQGGPHDHQTAAIAICLGEALKSSFKKYAGQVVKNAQVLAMECQKQGLRVVSGGTDNHLLLLDLTPLKITGKEAEILLDQVGITVNKNMIPYDQGTPFNPSGVRLGTPAVTSRGMQEKEMIKIAQIIAAVLKNSHDKSTLKTAVNQVKLITKKFPVPGINS